MLKFNKIRLVGAGNVDLPLAGGDESEPFVLKSAEGLGPPEITVHMAETTLEKRVYQGKKAVSRQPVLLVGLHPDWNIGQTPRELRQTLYGLLTPRYGRLVKLQLLLDDVVQAECEGQISRMEISVFTQDPQVQITLECDYPYFLAPVGVRQQPVHRLVGSSRAFDVLNDGSAPAGFLMGVTLMANVGTTLTLSDEDPAGQKLQIEGINWVAGDRLVVDTRPGSRGVWRGPGGGTPVTVLNNVNRAVSEWIQLYGGDNTLLINTTAMDWDPAYDFQHLPAYWGV